MGVFLAAFSLTAPQVLADEPVERVFCNARIFTGEQERPYAEAVAIRNDKIAAVGSCVDVKKTVGNQAEVVDLHGQWLLPGLIDSHSHSVQGGLSLISADVGNKVQSMENLVAFGPENNTQRLYACYPGVAKACDRQGCKLIVP